jgi:hypothetical protein
VPSAPAGNALGTLLAACAGMSLATGPVIAGQIEELNAGVKYFQYQESGGRMSVRAPLAWVKGSVAPDWDIEASTMVDSLSGASAQYVTNQGGRLVHALSSASIRELRQEQAVKLTRWLGDDSVGLGWSLSDEHDYRSETFSLDTRLERVDKNVTLAFGVSGSRDQIGATGKPSLHESRHTVAWFAGLTQVLSPTAIIQGNLELSDVKGYFDDPYKYTLSFFGTRPVVQQDHRPDARHGLALLVRYRQFVHALDGAFGADARHYQDNWGIRSQMLDLSWHQNFASGWSLRPSLRYYSQDAADFYSPTFTVAQAVGSSDARLGAFGAWSTGIKLRKQFANEQSIDLGLGYYRQRAAWHLGGNGSAGLPDFKARFVMLGWQMPF